MCLCLTGVNSLGSKKCTWGPSYWCSSMDAVNECGFTAKECLTRYGMTVDKRQVLVGGNKCTWGPSHWCSSMEAAKSCGVEVTECDKYGMSLTGGKADLMLASRALLGASKCTWGPSYWCSDMDAANECGHDVKSCAALGMILKDNLMISRELLVGSNKCTWGPAHWCSSKQAASDCGVTAKRCVELGMSLDKREVLVGGSKCTWGPSHWCSSMEAAKSCGIPVTECDRLGMSLTADKVMPEEPFLTSRGLLGSSKCTWGPSYWCTNMDAAKECGQTAKSCMELGRPLPMKENLVFSRALVGSNKCTWGPAHWCASKENADGCGTRDYCEEKVWKQQ